MLEILQEAFIRFLHLLNMTSEQLIAILIFPMVVDVPRSIGKAAFLLLHELYERLISRREYAPIQPLVSVIVPAHNEEEVIERSITSLIQQDYSKKEIIVVDDGSTDRTYEIAGKFASRGLIKLVQRKASGRKAQAVNFGVVYSSGEILVVVDADTVLEPSTLSEMIRPFSDPEVGAVSGNVRVLNRRNLLTQFQAYEYMMAMEMGRRFQAIMGFMMIIPGALGAIRRSLAVSIGLYDSDTLTEDFDITVKIHKSKMKVRFAPNALGWTAVPECWRDWIKQRIRWTAGQLETLIKHRNLFFERYFGVIGLIAAPDMLLMDVILLFIRIIWLIVMSIYYFHLLPQLFFLIFLLYLLNELTIVAVAAILSSERRKLVFVALAPIIVLFYRPLYSLVRMKAYIGEMVGQSFKW